MIKNQKSFGVAVLLMILVMVFIIGTVIWLIYNRQPSSVQNPENNIISQGEDWSYGSALQAAINEKDPGYCDKINKGHTIQDVQISTSSSRKNCKIGYAVDAKDVNYCRSLPDNDAASVGSLTSRGSCLASLGRLLKTPELCEAIPARDKQQFPHTFESCLEQSKS